MSAPLTRAELCRRSKAMSAELGLMLSTNSAGCTSVRAERRGEVLDTTDSAIDLNNWLLKRTLEAKARRKLH